MEKYSPFKIPFLSFYSKSLYRDACFNWKGTGFAYLFYLILANGGVIAVVESRTEAPKYYARYGAIADQFPQITFENGIAHVDVPQPYVINDPETRKPCIIIDTTGRTKNLDESAAEILITKHKMVIKDLLEGADSVDFKELDYFVITKEHLRGLLKIAHKFWAIFVFVIVVFVQYISYAILILIFSLIAILFANWRRLKLPFNARLRLTSIAITPSILIDNTKKLSDADLTYAWVFYIAITAAYLYWGIRQCSQDFTFTDDSRGDAPAAPGFGASTEA